MTACSRPLTGSAPRPQIPPLPVDVAAPCPALPPLDDKSMGTLASASGRDATQYVICQRRHRAAVQAYEKIRRVMSGGADTQ